MLLFRSFALSVHTGSDVQKILLSEMVLDTRSNEVTHTLQLQGVSLAANRNRRATIGASKQNALHDRANRATKRHHQAILVGFHVAVLIVPQVLNEGFVRETLDSIPLRSHPARQSKNGNTTIHAIQIVGQSGNNGSFLFPADSIKP